MNLITPALFDHLKILNDSLFLKLDSNLDERSVIESKIHLQNQYVYVDLCVDFHAVKIMCKVISLYMYIHVSPKSYVHYIVYINMHVRWSAELQIWFIDCICILF